MIGDDQKKGFLILGFLIVALTLPYLIFYVLPFVVIGLLCGLVWDYGCSGDGSQDYGRVALFIPATLILVCSMLWFFSPSRLAELNKIDEITASDDSANVIRSSKKGRGVAVTAPVMAQNMNSPDPFNETFNGFYTSYYGALWNIDRRSRVSFNYDQFIVIVLSAILLLAPLFFFFLYLKNGEDLQKEFHENLRNESMRLNREHQSKLSEIGEKERKFNQILNEMKFLIQKRDEEIERLRLREKYLSEGKPKPMEQTPQGPDLEFL